MSSLRESRQLREGLITLAGYGVLVFFLTWPLLPNAATHLPNTAPACAYDTLYSGWALAHEATALFASPTGFVQGNNYFPTPSTLFYGPMALGALPYFAPVFLLTGNPTLALNLTFLASVILTAWSLHLVVHRWTAWHAAGAIAACSFLFTGWVLWEWLPTAPHWGVLQYIPWIILLSATPSAGRARCLALLALVPLQCLTDVTYVAPAVLAPLVLLGVVRAVRPRTRRAGVALLGVVALALVVVAVPVAGHLRVRADNPELIHQTYWRSDPDFFRQYGTVLPWGLFARNAPTALPSVAFWLIGAGVLGFARGRERQRDAWRSAALWAGVGTLMSLTPSVRLGGEPFDLPQAWLAEWMPIYRAIRVPSRLGVSGLMGLSLLAGLAFAECAGLVSRTRPLRDARALVTGLFAAAVVAGMYLQYREVGSELPRPDASAAGYAIQPAIGPDSPFLSILRQPGGPLLELPASLKPPELAPIWHARAMYRSIFHGRNILNGYASYWPATFPERMALAVHLPRRDALIELRRRTGFELFWVHTDDLPPEFRALWIRLAESGGRDYIRPIARDGGEILFDVRGAALE